MALLINKPKRVVINTSVQLTVNRPELASMFASDAYWSNTSNWKTVYFYYRDPSGKQNITAIFPEGKTQGVFFPSLRVKQAGWILDKVVVKDYDRGLKTLLRRKNLAKLSECDIVVAVANRAPSKIFLSNTSPEENQTFVGNLTATDPDILDPLTYTVVSGFEDAESFEIVGNNALYFVTAPNFEVKNQYSVKIKVTDSSDAFYEEVFVINVVDVNDAPGNITLSSNTINENAPIDTVIGTFSVTDEDATDSHTFVLSGADADSFILNGNQLKSSAVFDYEDKASYSITIIATDSAGATFSKNFNISVLNVNEAPTGITLSANAINEYNSVNAIIGYLTTADVDGGDTFTYSVIGGDTSAFNINGNQLRASVVFDYETKSSYSVTIRSTDAGGLTYDKSFSVSVTNISEAPTNISLSSASINENSAANTVIGTLSATKPTSQSVSFSLVGGDVASFNINGTQLRSSASFDYETKNSYSVTIRATSGGEFFEKSFTITVNNVIEAVTNILLSSTSIDEKNEVNAVIGTLTPVGEGSATFSVVSGSSNFNISGNQLRASVSLNADNQYSVTIRATTSGGTYDKAFTITANRLDLFPKTGLNPFGGTLLGYQYASFSDTAVGNTLFYIGVWDNDYDVSVRGYKANRHYLKIAYVRVKDANGQVQTATSFDTDPIFYLERASNGAYALKKRRNWIQSLYVRFMVVFEIYDLSSSNTIRWSTVMDSLEYDVIP